jgi:hypothetical protein
MEGISPLTLSFSTFFFVAFHQFYIPLHSDLRLTLKTSLNFVSYKAFEYKKLKLLLIKLINKIQHMENGREVKVR